MELVRINRKAEVQSPELRERAESNALNSRRMQFVLRASCGEEVAFLAFDVHRGKDYLVLYYLWVARHRRRAGVGSAALLAALRLARDTGHKRLLVLPSAIDEDVTLRALRRWYRRRGFVPWPEQEGMLQREVEPDA